MQAQSFQLTGYTVASSRRSKLENERLSNLRSVIREAIARGITLVLDEERFLHRVAGVIAESSGYPIVVAYVAEADSDRMSLGAATEAAPTWLPRRLPASPLQSLEPTIIETSSIFGDIDGIEDSNTVAIPLVTDDRLLGVLLILHVDPAAISEEDLEAFSIVGEEIAPAVRVANAHRQVRDSVIVDLATGAYTYSFFVDRLDQEISRAQRSGRAITIILVEASDFDEFEAAAGFDMGDRMLKDLASGFADLMRMSDIVARRGRTGFALLLPDSDIEGASVTIERIDERLAQVDSALEEEGYSGPTPAVIAGSATFPTDGNNSAALILVADQRMLADVSRLDGE